MGVSVDYSVFVPYSFDPFTGKTFPGAQVTIYGPAGSDAALAYIDTGADYCYFNGDRCRALGINLVDGRRRKVIAVSGHETEFYLHEVELEFAGLRVPFAVGFSTRPLRREILGRNGFLEHIQLGIRERHRSVLIEPRP